MKFFHKKEILFDVKNFLNKLDDEDFLQKCFFFLVKYEINIQSADATEFYQDKILIRYL